MAYAINLIDWLTKFLQHYFLSFIFTSLFIFIFISTCSFIIFLDVYQYILGGWGVKGKICGQWLLWTWFNSRRSSLACRQLRLPDSRWSRILTQFLDANLLISSHEIYNLYPRVIKLNVDDAFLKKTLMCWI